MSSPATQLPRYTREEYYALDAESAVKLEYLDGLIVAMGGASPEHVLLADNLQAVLRARLLPKDCRPYSSDLYLEIGKKTFHPERQ